MRDINLSVLDRITLDELESTLDRHTRKKIKVDQWTRFTWSASRHRMFTQCKRKYYLNYYGSRRVREANDEIVSAIWWLKQVTSLRAWVGTVIHYVAVEAIRAYQEERDITPSQWMDTAIDYYRGGMVASERGIKYGDQWLVLFETIYPGESSSIDHDAAEALVGDLANTLMESEAFKHITKLRPSVILEVDEPFQAFPLQDVPVLGSVHTFAIPDVLIHHGQSIEIIDWKTGDAEAATIRDQAGIYRLYASERYRLQDDAIHVIISDLGSGGHSIEPAGGTPTVEEARQFALDSIQAMVDRMEDVDYHTVSIVDYPMTEDLSICHQCRFKRACWRHEDIS